MTSNDVSLREFFEEKFTAMRDDLARIEQRLATRDAEVDRKIDDLRRDNGLELVKIHARIDAINLAIARWSGGIAVAMFVAGLAIHYLLR